MFNCGSVARKQAVNRRGSRRRSASQAIDLPTIDGSIAVPSAHDIKPLYQINESEVATKTKNSKLLRKPYTASDIKMLKTHSKARTPVQAVQDDRVRFAEAKSAVAWNWPSAINVNIQGSHVA